MATTIISTVEKITFPIKDKHLQYLFSLMIFSILLPMGTYAQNKEEEALYSLDEGEREVELENAVVINSESLEFAPIFYGKGLVFVSSRRKMGRVDASTGETFFELYYSELGPGKELSKPQNFSMELNSQWHEGPVSFSEDGNKIFLTRSNSENGLSRANKKGNVVLKIYEADRGYWDWENIKELPFNSDNYNCMHPTLSKDGNRLYFISDMPGGYGGLDVWFVNRDGNKWSNPINLEGVNTNKNESFPFIHESGMLFFASDGFKGEGGLDLYMVDLNKTDWQVLNLGEVFNSKADDFGFVLDGEGKKGYFSSNREGGNGKDDIYQFKVNKLFKGVEYAEPEKTGIDMIVVDGANNQPLDESYVWVFEVDDEGNIVKDTASMYDIKIEDAITDEGKVEFKYVRNRDKKLTAPDYVTDGYGKTLLSLESGKNYLLSVKKDGYEGREMRYPQDFGGRRSFSFPVTKQNCLTVSGMVMSRGYNTEIPGTKVTIINDETGEKRSVYADLDGSFTACLAPGYNYTIIGEKNKFESVQSKVSTKDLRNTYSLETELVMQPSAGNGPNPISQPISKGTVIILNDIYYDFGKSAIRTGSARDLETVVQLMQRYPSMSIELGAYTDSRGESDFNMQLSLRRAESARDFIIQRGVDPNRITAFGYGESNLRNHCDDGIECSEEEHSFNRRTEIKVTKINEPIRFEYKRRR